MSTGVHAASLRLVAGRLLDPDAKRVLAAAEYMERLSEQLERLSLAYIEATNPGIDMEEVRRGRAT